MDVILSQLTRAQLQTHSVEALHAELQQLEGVFKSAVQTLQRISSVRDTAAKFLVDCDDTTTLEHLTRIHALREDAAIRLDLLTTEIHMRRVRFCVHGLAGDCMVLVVICPVSSCVPAVLLWLGQRDAERQARKKTASPSPVKPEASKAPVASPRLAIDFMSPLSSPAGASTAAAAVRQAPHSQPTLTSPSPSQQPSPPPAAQRPVTQVVSMPLNPPSPRPRNEIEISDSSDSGSDTESDDEDIPVSALLGRQEQQQHSGSEPQSATSTCSNSRSSTASHIPNNGGSGSESRVKAERTRIPVDTEVPLTVESQRTTAPASQPQQHQQRPADQQRQQDPPANLSKNQLKKLKKKKSKAMRKATAGSGGVVYISASKPKRAEQRRQQFQTQ